MQGQCGANPASRPSANQSHKENPHDRSQLYPGVNNFFDKLISVFKSRGKFVRCKDNGGKRHPVADVTHRGKHRCHPAVKLFGGCGNHQEINITLYGGFVPRNRSEEDDPLCAILVP